MDKIYYNIGEDFNMNKLMNCTITDERLLPKYQTAGASGTDLMARAVQVLGVDEEFNLEFTKFIVNPGERVIVKTGLCIELPEDVEAQVRPRSGLAYKAGITVVNTPGTVDEDYRGEIGVILINHGKEPFTIAYGDRIAQLVFMDVKKFDLNPVQQLSETQRGTGAYGSTGK